MTSNTAIETVAAILDRHRALAVLTTLAGEDCCGSAPLDVLADVLGTLGLGCARTKLRDCLDRLERSGLVALTSNGTTTVVRLTEPGSDVVHGRARADGVQPLAPPEPR